MGNELAIFETTPPPLATDADPLPFDHARVHAAGAGHARELHTPAPVPPPHILVPADLLEHWLAGRSPRTTEAYGRDLADFARYLDCRSGLDALELLLAIPATDANAWVLRYRNAMLARGLATATIARRLAAIRSVVAMAHMLGLVTWTIDIRAPRIEARRDVRGPDKGERRKLWKYLRSTGDGPAARRDRAIFALLFDLGLRRAELLGIGLADVAGQAAGTVAIRGKGHREKELLTLPEPTMLAITDWIESRGRHDGPLFDLTGDGLAFVIRSVGRKAGLPRRLRPHGLRHAAITAALDAGNDVRKVRKFSRHAKLETVIRYDDARDDTAGEIARGVSKERR